MLLERRVPCPRPGPARVRLPRLPGVMLVVLSAVAVGATSCTGPVAHARSTDIRLIARIHPPAAATAVLTGSPDVLAAELARELFASAPVVVVADGSSPAAVPAAAILAERTHAPLLLTSSRAGAGAGSAVLRAEVRALRPRAVLSVGLARQVLAAQLPGINVVTGLAMLPRTSAPPPLHRVVVLVHQGSGAAVAATATARVAGARVVFVRGYDPRASSTAISALAAARPTHVLAIGAGFGPAGRLAARVTVAATGVQLPGGGQVLFPGHRLVALYGYPGTPGLGALGQQSLAASIARVRRAAAPYRALSGVPVVPTFEIIASVAQGPRDPGPDGSYSYESSVASLRPWVRRATAAGMYVVLDLQPGRASVLAQARKYAPLLRLPNVGLAVDPEWKLQPSQLPLHQIGGVSIAEVNSVIRWLARLTARYHLPQKLLVLHQFRLSMIRGERWLNTRQDDLAILIHMDGQGTPTEKRETWAAVLGAAPAGVFFGWKDFYQKDHPMLSPEQTMARTPQPVMISYQ